MTSIYQISASTAVASVVKTWTTAVPSTFEACFVVDGGNIDFVMGFDEELTSHRILAADLTTFGAVAHNKSHPTSWRLSSPGTIQAITVRMFLMKL
jgi:hypothetical protein